MRLIQRANRAEYKRAIVDPRNNGRLPLAWFTVGHIGRLHERFWLLRIRPAWGARRHRNHDYDIEGRYWHGLAWRATWGYRWRWRWIRIPRWRRVLLDPDIVTRDPGQADDWGTRPGEDWPRK